MDFFRRFNPLPVFLACFLLLISLLMIWSTSADSHGSSSLMIKQLIFAGVGLLFMLVCILIDYEFWKRIMLQLYIIGMLLLLAVCVMGHTALGAQRWMNIGGFTFQPSEFFKLVAIVVLAFFLSRYENEKTPALLFKCLAFLLPALLLILLQPDLGTALVIIGISLGMFYLAGVNPWWLLGTCLAGLGSAPFVLHSYQKKRLLIFLNPEIDPQGAGWNITQSKIAIGSGGILGKGLRQGSQTQLNYVPEHSTDFIFSAIGEELGFLASIIIILLYFTLLYSILKCADEARDSFGRYLVIGVFLLFLTHIFINIGMTMGIMPVTGIPLCFMSYGGSALITDFIALGLVLSVYQRRKKLF